MLQLVDSVELDPYWIVSQIQHSVMGQI